METPPIPIFDHFDFLALLYITFIPPRDPQEIWDHPDLPVAGALLDAGGGNPVTTFQGFMLDLRKGSFRISSLQLTDWQANSNKTLGPFNTAISGGWYVFNLTSAKATINKLTTSGGLTQVRLCFKLDDNNNGLANYISLYSGNTGAASRPQLIVEYYVP